MKAGDLLTNYDFIVYLGENSYGFSKVSNLSAELEYESVGEGGRNLSPLLFVKPKGKQDVLSLERGVRLTPEGVSLTLDTGTHIEGGIISTLMGGDPALVYTFDEGLVTKVELGNLDAMGRDILIEKMEIAHTGLKQLT